MADIGRESKLEIGGRCLAVFVDETGHEELKGSRSTVSVGAPR